MSERFASVRLVMTVLVGLILAGILLVLGTGPAGLGAAYLSAAIGGGAEEGLIVWQLRLPRALLAVLIGAGLGLSGAAMQGLFRNPLADPSIIGVTSGAALGASLAIALASVGHASVGLTLLVPGAFVGGLAASALVYRMATGPGGTSVMAMLLIGVAITALAGAVNSGLAYLVDNEALRRMSLWQMGGLGGADWRAVLAALGLMAPGLLWLPRQARALDALLLGESEARHLGVDVPRLLRGVVLMVALTVAAAVALGGVIAFVGLVVPHLLRLLLGPGHARLLPASALGGAALLLLADALARVLLSPAELPVGILTALLGAPFFILLLWQRRLYWPV